MYENKQNTLLIPFMKIFELKTTVFIRLTALSAYEIFGP